VTTVDERQVGSAPAVVLSTSQRVENDNEVLVSVSTSLNIVVDIDIVENVLVVNNVRVGVGVHPAIDPLVSQHSRL